MHIHRYGTFITGWGWHTVEILATAFFMLNTKELSSGLSWLPRLHHGQVISLQPELGHMLMYDIVFQYQSINFH